MENLRWYGPQKSLARTDMVEDISPVRRSALFLPSNRQLCIKQALAIGAIDRQTKIIAVERDKTISKSIGEYLLNEGFVHFTVYNGSLENLEITYPLDYVNIDLMGVLTERMLIWMRDELAPKIIDGAVLTFNLAYAWRGCYILPFCRDLFTSEYADVFLFHKKNAQISDNNHMTQVLLLYSVFHEYRIRRRFRDLFYQDNVNRMSVIRFDDVRLIRNHQNDNIPTIDDILVRYHQHVQAKMLKMDTTSEEINEQVELDMPDITFDNLPTIEDLKLLTLECLKQGITNSDAIRAAIAQKLDLIINPTTGTWNEAPDRKFVNSHAWALVLLSREGLIKKMDFKQYKMV